jgi:hypothetical protein
MFLRQHFYHQHIRKAIIAFGTIFNQITVKRYNSDRETVQSIRVPLSYSPKNKFLARIAEVPSTTTQAAAITLPRMGFEITGLQYNPSRKISVLTKNMAVGEGDSPNKLRSQLTSTPYDMTVALSIVAKNQDEALQIVEQILPFFNPDFCVTITDIPEMGIKRDLQITLDSVNYEDNYEGDYSQRRTIIWTLSFTLGINLYGPVDLQNIIRTSIANTYTDLQQPNFQQKYQVTTNPSDAAVTDDWDYVEQFDESFEQ